MTLSDALKMIRLASKKDVAAAIKAEDTVPTAVARRTLSPEHKAKMAEGRKRAAAAKAGTPPAKTPKAAKPATAAFERKPVEVSVRPHTTKRGRNGKVYAVGCMDWFVADGDEQQRRFVIDSINVLRTMPDADMARLMAQFAR